VERKAARSSAWQALRESGVEDGGGILFYYLFLKSKYVPIVFPLWGIIATSLAFIGILFVLFDYNVPMFVFLPILPLELAIGVWLMVKGFRPQEIKSKSG
jgi:hypothetical protein